MHSIKSNLLNEKEPRNRAVQRRDQQLFSLGLGVQITVELGFRLRERGKKTLVRCISCTKSEQYVAKLPRTDDSSCRHGLLFAVFRNGDYCQRCARPEREGGKRAVTVWEGAGAFE